MIVTIEMVHLYTCTISSCSCGRFYCCAQPKMNYLQEHSKIALLEAYLTNKSSQYCGQQCQLKFPDIPLPGKQTVYDLICRFR